MREGISSRKPAQSCLGKTGGLNVSKRGKHKPKNGVSDEPIDDGVVSHTPRYEPKDGVPFAALDLNTMASFGFIVGDPYVKEGVYYVPLTHDGVQGDYTPSEVEEVVRNIRKEQKTQEQLAARLAELDDEVRNIANEQSRETSVRKLRTQKKTVSEKDEFIPEQELMRIAEDLAAQGVPHVSRANLVKLAREQRKIANEEDAAETEFINELVPLMDKEAEKNGKSATGKDRESVGQKPAVGKKARKRVQDAAKSAFLGGIQNRREAEQFAEMMKEKSPVHREGVIDARETSGGTNETNSVSAWEEVTKNPTPPKESPTLGGTEMADPTIDALRLYYKDVFVNEDGSIVLTRKNEEKPFVVLAKDIPRVLELNRKAWPNVEKEDVNFATLQVLTNEVRELPKESISSKWSAIDWVRNYVIQVRKRRRWKFIADALQREGYEQVRVTDDGLFEYRDKASRIRMTASEQDALQLIAVAAKRKKQNPDPGLVFNPEESPVVNELYRTRTAIGGGDNADGVSIETTPNTKSRKDESGDEALVFNPEESPAVNALYQDATLKQYNPDSGKSEQGSISQEQSPVDESMMVHKRRRDRMAEELRQVGYQHVVVTGDGLFEIQKDEGASVMTASEAEVAELIAKLGKDRRHNVPHSERAEEIHEPREGFVPQKRREIPPDIEDARIIRSSEEVAQEIDALIKGSADVAYDSRAFLKEYPEAAKEFRRMYEAAGSGRDAAAYVWIQNRIATLRAEQQRLIRAEESAREKEDPSDTRFATEFGITREELERIPGYEKLSVGQHAMLFENFAQVTLGSVREEAARLYAAESAGKRASAIKKYKNFCGNILSQVSEAMGKDLRTLALEQKVVRQIRNGSFALHKELLTQLVQSMATHGPRVHIEKNGELVVDLVNIRNQRTRTEHEWNAMVRLNKAAHAFARVPASWRGKTLGVDDSEWRMVAWVKERFPSKKRNQEQTYTATEMAYQEERRNLEQVLRNQGRSNAEIAQILIGIDTRVYQLQTIQTSPEALDELAQIEHKDLLKESVKNTFVNGTVGYMALGYVSRSVLGFMPGFIGAPLVASGIETFRSRERTATSLKERDRNARVGVRDTELGALNIVPATQMVKIKDASGKDQLIDRGLIQKTQELIETYKSLEYESDHNSRSREMILERLWQRINYIKEKQQIDRIDYGSREVRVANQTRLLEVMGEALAILADNDRVTGNGAVTTRLDRSLKRTEAQIREARRKYRNRDLRSSIYKGVGFSIAGALFGEFFGGSDAKPTQSNPVSNLETIPQPPVGSSLDQGVSSLQSGEIPSAETADVLRPEYSPNISQVQTLGTHFVQSGDTLTGILKEQIPEIAEMGKGQLQETKIANIIKSLTPEDLNAVGILSEKADLIRIGEHIDLEKLHEMLLKRGIL